MKEQLQLITSQLFHGGIRLDEALAEFRKHFITTALLAESGNNCRAARRLGWHRNTLTRNCAELKIDVWAIRKQAQAARKPVDSEDSAARRMRA